VTGNRRQEITNAFEWIKKEKNGSKFQRVARKLLRRLYPNLNPLPDMKDCGQDAVASPLIPVRCDDRRYSFAFSLTPTLHKLKADCDRCKQEGHRFDVKVFTVWGEVTGQSRKRWEQEIRELYGWDLIVYDQGFLLDEAELSENEDLVAEELDVHRRSLYAVLQDTHLTASTRVQLSTTSPSCRVRFLSEAVLDGLVADRVKLGIEQREAWQCEQALNTFKSAMDDCADIISDKDKARIHANIGATYRYVGDTAAARQHCESARNLDPDNIEKHINLCILQLDESDFASAEQSLKEISQRFGPAAGTLNLYACLLHDTHRDEEAKAKLDEALSLDPDMPELHLNLGLWSRRRGDVDTALSEFTKAHTLDPNDYFARALKLETQASLIVEGEVDGNIEADEVLNEATALLQALDRKDPQPPKRLDPVLLILRHARGLIFIQKRDVESACAEYKTILDSREDAVTHANFGMAYVVGGNTEAARDEFRTAIAQGCRMPKVLSNVAMYDLEEFLNRRKDLKLLAEASEFFAELNETDPDTSAVDFLEGLIICAYSKLSRLDCGLHRAKGIYEQMVLDKDCPVELSIEAHKNLEAVEKLQNAVDAWRREQMFPKRRGRRGRMA